MARLSVFTLAARDSNCAELDESGPSRRAASRQCRAALILRVLESRGGADRPVAGALVSITDGRAAVIAGMTDSSGRVRLQTGRAVVPIDRVVVCLPMGDGRCATGMLTAQNLEQLRIDPAIHCNSILRLHWLEGTASVA